MMVVPFLDEPELFKLLKYSNIPCYNEMKRIVLAEIEKGNKILMVGDASDHPSETHVIIDFVFEPKCSYENLKSYSNKTGLYQSLTYCDNKGALEITFGRISKIKE
ncbi:MAG: hypothetical protein IJZ72_05845 [Oscillospiraceae bacterium]|nr:hypothetical protein [Oscillospiraceae bacterium]